MGSSESKCSCACITGVIPRIEKSQKTYHVSLTEFLIQKEHRVIVSGSLACSNRSC